MPGLLDTGSPDTPAPTGVSLRSFSDTGAARKNIYDKSLHEASNIQPMENSIHHLALSDVRYEDDDDFSLARQKKAILEGQTLGRRLRGTWTLKDKATGDIVDQKRVTMGLIPHMTERGTFILNGVENTLANQPRLRSGIFTRPRANGEIEARINVLPGKGFGSAITMDPDTGVFRLNIHQSKLPLFPILKALGANEKDMHAAWGENIYRDNKNHDDPRILDKLYKKILPDGEAENHQQRVEAVRQEFAKLELDPEVTGQTMGTPLTKVDPNTMMLATKRILGVFKGVEEPDDRDHMAYQTTFGPEEMFAERIRHAGRRLKPMLWKATATRSLKGIQPGFLSKSIMSAIVGSGLGQCFDPETKVLTRRGFVTWPKVTEEDEFLCRVDGELVYRRAVKLFKVPYRGFLLGCRSKRLSYLVTPNHRLWCKKKPHNYYPYGIETAKSAFGKGRTFETSLRGFIGYDADFKLTDTRTLPGDLWAAFVGWFLAEGWVSQEDKENGKTRLRVCISQSKTVNPDHCQEIESLLTGLSLRWFYNHSNATFVAEDEDLANELLKYGAGAGLKVVPRYCFEWTNRRLSLLCDAYMKGDGNIYNGYKKAETTSPALSESVVEMFGRLGGTGRISLRELSKKNNNWSDSYVISYGTGIQSHVSGESDTVRLNRPATYYKKWYDGLVYCAEVPGHMLYVLRDGKPHWSMNSLEETNPSEILDQMTRITRLGEGGISGDAVPLESRAVHPSQYGIVDPVRTPESGSAGVDTRLAYGTMKGSDGKTYSPFIDARSGQKVMKTPQELATSIIAFPGELNRPKKWVKAIVRGKLQYAPRDEVDFTLGHVENSFSPLANLIPFKTSFKGQRAAMGSRMLTQALSLDNPEAQLVQSKGPDGSFSRVFGKELGAVRSEQGGQVVGVSPDAIQVQGPDGQVKTHELYNWFPFNRKSFFHNTPTVEMGQQVAPGDLLARSNYTDANGHVALGLNLRTAYIPYKGDNFEDAVSISQAAAKRLASEHMYQHDLPLDEGVTPGKAPFISLYAAKYAKKLLDQIDDDGVVKPGTKVEYGDPLILGIKKKDKTHNQLSHGRSAQFEDQSVTWDHYAPGVVTDVAKTKDGHMVTVRSTNVTQVADKLCYDPETEILTRTGWKNITLANLDDEIATLNPDTQEIEFLRPASVQSFQHEGRMYHLDTTQVDLLVTDNHKLYAKRRYKDFALDEAKNLFGKFFRLKKNGTWKGLSPEHVTLPEITVKAGQSGNGTRTIPALNVPARTYAMLLGMFLSEGSVIDQPDYGNYGFHICQTKPRFRQRMLQALEQADVKFCNSHKGHAVAIYSLQWCRHFQQLGHGAAQKRMPEEVFGWDQDLLRVLYEWLMWGDGCQTGTGHSYCTTSKQLADDMQRLVFLLGMSANIKMTPSHKGFIKGKEYLFADRYDVYIYRHKNEPSINHGHGKTQNGQKEEWVDYRGSVHCVTMPKNHVVYVRRNGKTVWCGNSGLYGDKGVIASIIPDEKMPRDSEGRPFEILVNPLGIITRGNPSQMFEAWLGKIAAKTGKPYEIDTGNMPTEKMFDYVRDELAKHGLSDTEDIHDPESGRTIKGVSTGMRYFLKLHHLSEAKAQGRGIGGYTSENTPSRSGDNSAKRSALMDLNALLAHGAHAVTRDTLAIRGQKDEDMWGAFMSGQSPPNPRVPYVHDKFFEFLRGSGINPVKTGNKTRLLAMTDKAVQELAGDRDITNSETVDWKEGLKPIKGGLFDVTMTGGHGGRRWSAIKLHEPMPNPVMEEPIRKVLGLTEKRFDSILAGEEQFNGRTGPMALYSALDRINLPEALATTRDQAKGSRKTIRDQALKKLHLLKFAEKYGIHPREWFVDRVPVLPPAFRPVSVMSQNKRPLVADPNYLYKELFDANSALKNMHGLVPDLSEERRAVYGAFKGLVGLGDPIQPKNQERGVKGLLKSVFGNSPKFGMVQRKLLSTAVDTVGRATIIPNPDLDMDEAGIPESKAWEVYKPFVVRRMSRHGVNTLDALRMIKDQTPLARKFLQDELTERPVILTRAPVWHKYGNMAFKPKLVRGDALQISPTVVTPFTADFDGDAMNFHVPFSPEAVKEALEVMLPSKNLVSDSTFKVHYLPKNEYGGGLFEATRPAESNQERVFQTVKDMEQAYRNGEITSRTPVVILNT